MQDHSWGWAATAPWQRVTQIARSLDGQGVRPAEGLSSARNDARQDRSLRPGLTQATTQVRPAVLHALADPDRPTGPPPTFDANILETQSERLRQADAEARRQGRTASERDTPRNIRGPHWPDSVAVSTEVVAMPDVDVTR
jgi:hypothetical protein